MNTVVVASDHAGVELRQQIAQQLRARGLQVEDLGPAPGESVDYPDYAAKVASRVSVAEADLGVLVCGTGIGMCIAANKYPGVRAALLSDAFTGAMAREHNDANVVCLGARVTGPGVAAMALDAFLDSSPSENPRHQRRIEKLNSLGPTG